MKLGKYEFHRPAARSLRAQATFIRMLLRYSMWGIIGFFTLLFVAGVSLYIAVQTDWFHRWAAQQLTSILSDQLEAKLEFRSVRFNIFKGVELDSVSLSTRGDTVLSARSLSLSYELEPLLIRHIVISAVEIDDPDIRLLRSTVDSSWNVDHIVKPTPPNPNAKPFDWGITVRNVQLRNARLSVCDSLAFQPIENRIHYTRLNLDSLNVRLSASMNIAAKEFALSVDELRFRERRTGFQVDTMRLAVECDTSRLRIVTLRMITPQSNLLVHGTVDSLNIFDPKVDIESRPLNLMIERSTLAAADLNEFLPPDFSLRDQFLVKSEAFGSIAKLHFLVDVLRTRNTELHGSLTIENVANAKPFVYIVELKHSQANISDVKQVLPTVKLSDITQLNGLSFGNTRVYGTKDSLYANLDVHGEFGTVRGWSQLIMRGPLRYDASLDLAGFDTYTFTRRYSSSSRLNGRVQVQGSGTTLDDLVLHAHVNLGASSYAANDINSLQCNASVASRIITVDTLAINFAMSSADSAATEYDDRPHTLVASAQLDMRNDSMPAYIAHAELTQVPMARLLHDNNLPMSFSSTIDCNAKGFDPDSLEGSLNLNVQDFIMPDGALFPFALIADVRRSDAQHRTLSLRSDIADADISGRFRIASAWSVFLVHLGTIDKYVRTHYATVQSDTAKAPTMLPYSLPSDTLDLKYHVQLRGMAAIAPFIKGIRVDAKGEVTGSISGSPSCYQFVVDSARVQRFSMHVDQNYVFAQPMTMALRVQTENMTTQPIIEQARVMLRCDSVLRVNATRFVRPSIDISILDNEALFDLSTRIENHIPLRARGSMLAGDHAYIVRFDSLYVGWTRTLSFSSTQKAFLHMSPQGVAIDGIELKLLGGNDRVRIDGTFNATEFNLMQISLNRMDVGTIKLVPELADVNALQMLKGRIDTMAITIDGPYTKPRFTIGGLMSDLRYNDVPVGVQRLDGTYDGRFVKGKSYVTERLGDSVKTLTVDVQSLPLDIALAPVRMDLRDNEKVDITIKASKLSLAAVSPFVPGIANLNGRGDAQLTIIGTTPDNIDYTGAVKYWDASFIVPATNMRYTSVGHLSLKNTTVNFDSLRVFNEETDLRNGMALIGGLMHIRGFSIRDLDTWVEVDKRHKFQVMSEATAGTSDFMYGRTLISTQDNDIRRTQRRLFFHGTPDQPLLDGFVMIEDADVKFPPTVNRSSRSSSFEYIKVGRNYRYTTAYKSTPNQDTTVGDLPPEEPSMKGVKRKLGKSFIDILRTELDVKIASYMTVQMDFGFNDQLVAVVKQDHPDDAMKFIRIGSDSTSLRSDLIVDNSSTYKFYGNFSASGKMNIDGPIDNPRLEIKATLNNDRVINERKSNYKVFLNISGTKKKPILKMDYEIDGNEHPNAVGETEITTNAVLLTLFGYTQLELSGNSSQATGAVGNKLGASTLGVLLNRVLQGGAIKNVSIDFNGGVGDLSQARIQITAGLYGANVTLGGTVADPTITIDWALGELGGANLGVQLMKATTPGSSISRQQKQWEVRVGASIP